MTQMLCRFAYSEKRDRNHYLTSAFKKKKTFALLIETAHRNVVFSRLKHHWYSFRPEVICKMENKRETSRLGVCKDM